MKIRARIDTHESKRPWSRFIACAHLQLVGAHGCTDLHENFYGGYLISYELKFKNYIKIQASVAEILAK